MDKKPEIKRLENGGSIWRNRFNTFEATVYVPSNDKPDDILNYGYLAPYLLIFAPEALNDSAAVEFAREKGFEKLASDFATSVVFIYPTASDGWKNADKGIFAEILSNSAIHQYYSDGYVTRYNRFTKKIDDYRIRGAIFRTNLFGFGESADYIALNCLNHFEGDGLWGRADSAPVTCILTGLSVKPVVEADDIPVISIGNSNEINDLLKEKCKYLLVRDVSADPGSYTDYIADFYTFSKKFRRMLGELELDPDLESEGLVTEPGIETVTTSPDNKGDDSGTKTHRIGYFAFYKNGLFTDFSGSIDSAENVGTRVPLLIAFHGGGDSAFYIAHLSGWAKIALKYGFLLVSIENHLNSTATEMVELISLLKKKYPIDPTRVYVSGFSMGGCKSWDMVDGYPLSIAAAAPMDATFEMGLNVFGEPSSVPLNTEISVPVFYSGGEITPLPELPFQAQKCIDRIKHVLELNKTGKAYDIKLEDKDKWVNKIWGIDGDYRCQSFDNSRKATLTIELFKTGNRCFTALSSVSGQGHECREHTCENAWKFMSNFRRLADGTLEGGNFEDIKIIFT